MTLRNAAVRIALIILIGTIIAYVHSYSMAKSNRLDSIARLIENRGESEAEPFGLAQSNLDVARQDLLRRIDELPRRQIDAQFDAISDPYPDGTQRSPEHSVDLSHGAQIWIGPGVELDATAKRHAVAAHQILGAYGPAWRSRFPNLYFLGTEHFFVNYWYNEPLALHVSPDFDFRKESFYTVGIPENNPERQNVWTTVYRDPAFQDWMVSSITPIYEHDTFIGILGCDVYMQALITRTLDDHPIGARNLLLSRDGQLIAHPDYMDEIVRLDGQYSIPTHGDRSLKTLYRSIIDAEPSSVPENTETPNTFIVDNDAQDSYLAVTRLTRPDWFLLTEYPKSLIQSHALADSRVVLLRGIVALLLEGVLLFLMTRRFIAKPLNTLRLAFYQWASERGLAFIEPPSAEARRLAQAPRNTPERIDTPSHGEHDDTDRALDLSHADFKEQMAHATEKLQEANRQLTQLALYDPLTGLPNRKFYEQRLIQVIAKASRERQICALMFIDLDGFKLINETMGHSSGDQLLIEIGHRLKRALRESDTLARLGGDEFGVIVDDVKDISALSSLAHRLSEQCREPIDLTVQTVRISASIGIALYPNDVQETTGEAITTQLQRSVDLAMYQAKQNGKNTFAFFHPELTSNAQRYMQLTQALPIALRKRQFEVFYQPIVSSSDETTRGLEALVRWRHPVEGLLTPDRFIPEATTTRILPDIDLQVLDMVCRFLVDRGSESLPENGYVSVNFSPLAFAQHGIVERVSAILARYRISASRLAIEVTEDTFLEDGDAIDTVNRLHDMGIRILLDDFGTGYSALSYLKRIRLTAIKIDRYFIKDIESDSFSRAIVTTVISMASELGIDIIAEGIETQAQKALLASIGCRYLQGYYFAKPTPAAQLPRRTLSPTTADNPQRTHPQETVR